MVVRGLGMVAMALLLAACGGGGSGSGGGSPSGGGGATTPQGGLTLPIASSNSTVIAEEGAESGSPVVRYTSGGSASVSFGGITKTWRGTPTVTGDVAINESSDGRTVVVTARSAATSLQYASYGVWLESRATTVLAGSSSEVTGVSSFVIGDPTPLAAMPRAGTASYRGQAVAVELRGSETPRTMSGPLTASVDFAAGRLSATADLSAGGDGTGPGRVTMNGLAINGNQFAGSAAAGSHTGSVKGGFAGPNAAELGGTFELSGPSTVHGAFAARAR